MECDSKKLDKLRYLGDHLVFGWFDFCARQLASRNPNITAQQTREMIRTIWSLAQKADLAPLPIKERQKLVGEGVAEGKIIFLPLGRSNSSIIAGRHRHLIGWFF